MIKLFAMVCIFVMPVFTGIFCVWVHQDSVQLGYKLSIEEKERRRLISELEQVQVELAAAHSPERLIALAAQFGMVQPDAKEVQGLMLYPEELQ